MQYAYARANSVLKKYDALFPGELKNLAGKKYDFASATESERKLIKMMGDYPMVIENAGKNKAPNLLTKYMEELSAAYHALWASHSGVKLINENDRGATDNHMLLVTALRNVIANGLTTLGRTLKEVM